MVQAEPHRFGFRTARRAMIVCHGLAILAARFVLADARRGRGADRAQANRDLRDLPRSGALLGLFLFGAFGLGSGRHVRECFTEELTKQLIPIALNARE